jgi:hypothetical protein
LSAQEWQGRELAIVMLLRVGGRGGSGKTGQLLLGGTERSHQGAQVIT